MTLVDLCAAFGASAAGSAIAIRARMLRPRQNTWTEAPFAVWGSLWLLSLVLGMRAMTLWFGDYHATAWEALVSNVLALSSAALLWNLNQRGRQAWIHQQQVRRDVETAMEASGPIAAYQFQRRAR
jgi:hypothetical protein